MAIKISHLVKNVRTLEIEFDGESASVTYRPNVFTPAMQTEISEQLKDDAKQSQVLVDMLSKLLVKWDLEDDEGNPLPTDAEIIENLPLNFLSVVSEKIFEDMQAGEARAS